MKEAKLFPHYAATLQAMRSCGNDYTTRSYLNGLAKLLVEEHWGVAGVDDVPIAASMACLWTSAERGGDYVANLLEQTWDKEVEELEAERDAESERRVHEDDEQDDERVGRGVIPHHITHPYPTPSKPTQTAKNRGDLPCHATATTPKSTTSP